MENKNLNNGSAHPPLSGKSLTGRGFQTCARSIFKGKKKAFTLAEVLITLVIIGVIAALTLPTLIGKYQKQQTIVKLKKTYSNLSQTTSRAVSDNGPIETWELGENGSPEAATNFASKYLIPYLKIMRNCKNQTTKECEFVRKTRSGLKQSLSENYSRFFLNDGTLIGIYIYHNASQARALIYIDINGQKGPNLVGKDYFELSYNIYTPTNPSVQGKFIPFGMNRTREEILENDCNNSGSGFHCFSLIMKDNWEIKDDYPW